jgi:hypothetical protein
VLGLPAGAILFPGGILILVPVLVVVLAATLARLARRRS